MNLDQLRYFVETAQLEHLNLAAKKLHISPSAVSHAIKKLEDELGLELFSKEGKNINLTDSGRFTLKKARDLLQEVEKFFDEASAKEHAWSSTIKIACTHYLSNQFLPEALYDAQASSVKNQYDIQSLRSFEVRNAVLKGECDFGICFSPQEHPQLDIQILGKGQLFCTVSSRHPVLKEKKKDQLDALRLYPSVLPKAFPGIDVCIEHPMLKKYGLDLAPSESLIDNYAVAVNILRHSVAWSFLPEQIIKKEDGLTPISHPSLWQAPCNISLITKKGAYKSKNLLKNLNRLKDRLKLILK